MVMIETVKGVVMIIGYVLAKIIMEGLKVIIGLMVIGIIMFVIVVTPEYTIMNCLERSMIEIL